MNIRLERANSDIMRTLATAISGREDLHGVTLLGVDTSADFAWCNVSVDVIGDDARKQEVLKTLGGAAAFLRKEISDNVRLRTTPQLRFILDKGRDNANRVEELLAKINEGNK